MRPPAIWAPGAQVLGYTVERQLGQGGFGTVYLARCEGQSSALKLLHLKRVGERAEREVSILTRLRHPNVVGILGHGYWPVAEPQFAVIAMEYVAGRQLDVWAQEENPTARQVARVALDVARALAAAHADGVVHRDVKEANVMVRTADGLAKLVDFGIGDYEGARSLTQDILPPGTVDYRSPEAWRFLRSHRDVPDARFTAGPADDLWALGLVLYQLLTARFPFDGPDANTLTEAILSSTPTPPHEVNERVPSALSDVCLRLLEKTPEARTSSAQAVCASLEEALRGADPTWDVPLCEAYDEGSATTEGGGDSFEKWRHRPRHRPRRGKRAAPEKRPAPSADVDPDAVAEAPPQVTTVRVSPRMARPSRAWAALALAVVVVAMGAVLVRWTPRASSPVPTRQEVAPSGKSPQAGLAAAPTGPEAIAAAVALPATLQEVSATVTTQTTDSPPLQLPSKPTKKGMSVMARAVSTAAACTALACPGPQVRPAPPPEPCPAGAVKAMAKLGIGLERKHEAVFTLDLPQVISVQEGPTQLILFGDWKDMPSKTTLSGRLIVRDRVYGRLTWATTPKGESFPVCLEVLAEEGARGMAREPGDDSPSSARIFTSARVKAVSEFE
ncbi:serine/threonine protein kinase [Corallococcus praedator]|uniref:Serine/threonine protein kinase n=1 Tax=Corallococcus praedator TaxID=2316724 RepID=A0ABX9QRE7_9BACT|nr:MULTISPECIES: serine/threonine-protein kinase [Corallococcus]RKH34912.1 serine/threonine protein kinase [Corallococcus sp. CA031C]RKI17112.1 serine/threonine protein kinase [Corallococcus praedator]